MEGRKVEEGKKKRQTDENEKYFYLETEITNTAVNMEKKLKL